MSSSAKEKHDELMEKLSLAKQKWDVEDSSSPTGPDETDCLLSKAIELALEQGKGWSDAEKEEYMKRICDDDNLPPIFATSAEEVEKSGLADAFSSLIYEDENPGRLMLEFKQKGNDAFMCGKRNVAKNVQYYRDAINHYYEAIAWAEKVQPVDSTDKNDDKEVSKEFYNDKEEEEKVFKREELDEMMSTLYANAAMAHLQLKNWGYVRENCKKALEYNKNNIKAWYRLAKAHQMLHNWEDAGDAIDSGLSIDDQNKDLLKLQSLLQAKVRKARQERQKREKARALRVKHVKDVWKHCKKQGIQLGRIPLVSTVTDEDDDDDAAAREDRWNHHHHHTGKLPQLLSDDWTWPCMFLYPSYNQSDFIEHFAENEMLAVRIAQMFPELEDLGSNETVMPWDTNNEFVCSNLEIYFEVHCTEQKLPEEELIHPDSVELLKDQGTTMRFYEASRALLGDEGPDMANVARLTEQRHLYRLQKAWKGRYGNLWSNKPDSCPVVRVHPAVTLGDILMDERMVVVNFMPTLLLFPQGHPSLKAFLKEHKCIDVLNPKNI